MKAIVQKRTDLEQYLRTQKLRWVPDGEVVRPRPRRRLEAPCGRAGGCAPRVTGGDRDAFPQCTTAPAVG
eukprot:10543428-Alexandrium_andersonii.AAC.1